MRLSHIDITAEPEASEASIQEALNGDPSTIPFRLHRKKDGTVFPVEIARCMFAWKGRTVLCGVTRDISERVVREREIQKTREDLRHLASELTMAEQRERQRLASELHDSISQLLSSAYLRLDRLRQDRMDESVLNPIDKVCHILDQALSKTRSLTFELSFPLLTELGLAASLEELCSSMSREHGIRIEFVGNRQPVPLPMDHKIVIYRAVGELLMNVLKHSGAHCARVQMKCQNGKVEICVKDDGQGFDASTAGLGFSPSGGFGLFSINEYIGHTGGALNIESAPSKGTEISFFVPLEV